jgi:plastocyanin
VANVNLFGASPTRVSRRTVLGALTLVALGGAVVSCAGSGAPAAPAAGQAPVSAGGVQGAANVAPLPKAAAAATAIVAPTATPAASGNAPVPAAPTVAPAATAAPTTIPTTAPAASVPTAAAAVAPQPTTVVVNMNDQYKFDPAEISIAKGTTVEWKNVGVQPHTVTCDPKKAMKKTDVILPSGAEPFDSGLIMGGKSYQYTFTVVGKYQYVCTPHEAMGMIATVTVA